MALQVLFPDPHQLLIGARFSLRAGGQVSRDVGVIPSAWMDRPLGV